MQVHRVVGIVLLIVLSGRGGPEEKTLFFEGFNSDFSNPWAEDSWGRGVWGVIRSEIRPAGDEGTAATEGDGFCMMNVTAKPVGTPKLVCCHCVNLGVVAKAGVTYSFSGDFGWRNASREGAQADYSFKPNKNGFKVGADGQAFGHSHLFNFADRTDGEHRFTQLSFTYTTVEQDIGKPIQLALTLHGENSQAGTVELLTDNWRITARGMNPATPLVVPAEVEEPRNGFQPQNRPEPVPKTIGLLTN